MSDEYNSILITKLFTIQEEDENFQDNITEILEEMQEIKNPIFLYPIYETYKKYAVRSQ